MRVEPAQHQGPGVRGGAVHGPQAQLVHHEVDVGQAAPRVREGVVEAGLMERLLVLDGTRRQVIADQHVTVVFGVVQGAVVHHVARA